MKKLIVVSAAVLLAVLIIVLLFRSGGGSAQQPQTVTEEPASLLAHRIDVPYLSQKDLYPSGCESVSAVMALRYAGYEIDIDAFIDKYLSTGEEPYYGDDGLLYADSPYEVFIGTPYSEYSYGCYAPVIKAAMEDFLTDGVINAAPAVSVRDLTDSSLETLCREYIDRDVPVIVWGTIGMQPVSSLTTWILPDGSEFTWKSREHCLLLVGYDEDYYYFNDPMEGKDTSYRKADAEKAYGELYSQALAIVKK